MWTLAINKVLYNDHITKYRRVLAKDNKDLNLNEQIIPIFQYARLNNPDSTELEMKMIGIT